MLTAQRTQSWRNNRPNGARSKSDVTITRQTRGNVWKRRNTKASKRVSKQEEKGGEIFRAEVLMSLNVLSRSLTFVLLALPNWFSLICWSARLMNPSKIRKEKASRKQSNEASTPSFSISSINIASWLKLKLKRPNVNRIAFEWLPDKWMFSLQVMNWKSNQK